VRVIRLHHIGSSRYSSCAVDGLCTSLGLPSRKNKSTPPSNKERMEFGKLVAHLVMTWTGLFQLGSKPKRVVSIRLGTYSFFVGQRRVIANNIIDGNANRKGNSSINGLAIDLFRVELVDSRHHDGLSEFTDIQNLGPGNALCHETFQRQIHNFGSFLILGADITKRQKVGETKRMKGG
jgi:hypothetical protein